jgi:hypothetical protein
MPHHGTITATTDGTAERRDWDADDLVRRVRAATQPFAPPPAVVPADSGRLADLCFLGGALGSIALIANPPRR